MEDPTAAIRVPVSQTEAIAVKAVLEGEGLVEGIDHRGAPVIAYATPIEDSEWYLVAAIDADEALADWPRRRRVVIVFTLVGAIALVAVVMLIGQRMAQADREAQRALEAAEHAAQERLAITLRSIGDAVISTDASRRIEFMNPVAEELTGWSMEQAAGVVLSEVFVIINEKTREPAQSPVDIVLRDRVVVGLANHTILVSRTGTECAIADSAAPILGESGDITGVVLVFRDQTEERAASKALMESEERFRSLVEGAPDAIFVQTGGRFAYMNTVMCDLLGAASPDELIGRPVVDSIHPDYRDLALQRIKALNEAKSRQAVAETVFLRADGSEVRAETSGSPIVYGEDGALVFVRDITERKAAERALAHSYELLRYIIEYDRSAIAVYDRDMRYLYASRRFANDYRLDTEDLVGRSHYDVFPEVPERWKDVHRRALAGETLGAEEDMFVRLDGAVDWVSWECRPWYTTDGSIGGIILYSEVVTERVNTQRALRASEERLRTLSDNIPGGYVYQLETDADNTTRRFTYVSAGVEKVQGITVDEALANPAALYEAIHQEDTQRLAEMERHSIEKMGTLTTEFRTRDLEGALLWLRIASKPHRTDDGRVVWDGIAVDVTEQKRFEAELRETTEYLESLFANANAPIIVWDADLRISRFNQAAETLAGRDAAEVIGENLGILFPPDRADQSLVHIAETSAAGRPEAVELPILRVDGTVRTVLWSSAVVYAADGMTPVATIAQGQDITERKAAEEELVRHRAHLEELVAERTSAIEAAKAEIEAANCELFEANIELEKATNAKSAFLASMSHELRTPLNSIIGYSGILTQGIVGPLSDEQYAQVMTINRSGIHLLSLINDVLDLSKIEAGKVEVRNEPFDPGALTREVVETIRPLAEEKALELAVEVSSDGRLLRSDEGKVRQILLNLVGNAVKFTAAGSVRITCERDAADAVVFEVTDTGPGIARGDLRGIFEAFSQVGQDDALKPEGTGLGLSLSQQFARLLGGEVTVHSKPGTGSTFRLRVPDPA